MKDFGRKAHIRIEDEDLWVVIEIRCDLTCLGLLPERETVELGLRLIAGDGGLFEEMSLAEHDIIEDYLDGMLSEEEAFALARNFA